MLSVVGDGFADLVVFGEDPGVGLVAVAVELSKCFQTSFWLAVSNELFHVSTRNGRGPRFDFLPILDSPGTRE